MDTVQRGNKNDTKKKRAKAETRARAARGAATNTHQNRAFGKDCRKCGGNNHFAKCCFSKTKVQLVEKMSDSEDKGTGFYVEQIDDVESASEDEWIAHLAVNGTDVLLKLDTGAQENILPKKDFYRLNKKHKVCDKKINLRIYDDKPIPTQVVCRVILSNNEQKVNALFVLVEGNRKPY